jgi:hypothetical protein
MAPRDRSHILVPSPGEAEPFSPSPGRDGPSPPSPADRAGHGSRLKDELEQAFATGSARRPQESDRIEGAIDGIYVEFESVPGFDLALTSLEPLQGKIHPELRAVKTRTVDGRDVQYATVFVPDGWIGRFVDRFEAYVNEDTPKGHPKNRKLVERIASLRLATLQALWTDGAEQFPSPGSPVWWELWLRRRQGVEARFASFVQRAGLRAAQRKLAFEDRVVVLLEATAEQLADAIDMLDDLAELRRPAEAFQFLADLPSVEQGDFVRDLAARVLEPTPDAPATCILDTGVAHAHPLLTHALAPDDCHVVDPAWNAADHAGHGTQMAGLALYGDLGEALASSGPHRLASRLESVKILPDVGANDPDLYGAITATAAATAEIAHPQRRRTFTLAVTAPNAGPPQPPDLGLPTSWSATLDALAAGRSVDSSSDGLVYIDDESDRAPRLFVVATGNVRSPFEADHLTRSDVEPVEDPGQAWNVLTVGAFTELRDLSHDPTFVGWTPLAAPGDLSPFSRTSVSFKKAWPYKPEIVVEGGNAAVSPAGSTIDTPPGLQVLTTAMPSASGRLLTTACGTSAASAQAACIASAVAAGYPSLWPESIRALLVHSARWTAQMTASTGAPTRQQKVAALRRYGWGVASLDRAVRSASDAVTLVVQDTIRPYADGKMREMHVHDLPWPREVLEDLGDARVELRVALSYFVEPNPARRGWSRRFRYASHGLRFDVRRPVESTQEFRQRLNRLALAEDEDRPQSDSDSDQWFLGPKERVRGSLHVDVWTGTAAELAARGCIAVFPVTGWWKEQPKRDRSDEGARYSLVVSIESPEVDVDVWTPVAVAAQVPVSVET